MGISNTNIKRVFRDIARDVDKAEIAAINRAAKSALAKTTQEIRKDYNIKAAELKKAVKVTRATRSKRYVRLIIGHKAIGLIKFRATQPKRGKGVKVTIRKGKRELYKGAFIQKMPTGHIGVMKRKGKSKYPIKELYGPSAMQLYGSDISMNFIEKSYFNSFEKNFESALKHYLSK